jgi:hypothetical protein
MNWLELASTAAMAGELRAMGWSTEELSLDSQQREEIFLFFTVNSLALERIQPSPVGIRVFSQEQSGRSANLTTYLHLVQRLNMRRATGLILLFHTPS